MGALAPLIAGLLKQKAAGSITGLLASKTQYGASAIAGSALWAVVPRALDGDAEAVGQVVLALVGWAVAIWGRLRAGK